MTDAEELTPSERQLLLRHAERAGAGRGWEPTWDAAVRTSRGARRGRSVVVAAVAVAALVFGVGLATTGGEGDVDGDSTIATRPATPTTEPAPPPTEAATRVEVSIFFGTRDGDCSTVVPVRRTVDGPAVLTGAMTALLEGPTPAERTAGATSWFHDGTAGTLRSVRIEEGVALVDVDDLFGAIDSNVATSCGSEALLSQLIATATQFDTVDRALFSLDGDREAFYAHLERVPPEWSTTTVDDGTATSELEEP